MDRGRDIPVTSQMGWLIFFPWEGKGVLIILHIFRFSCCLACGSCIFNPFFASMTSKKFKNFSVAEKVEIVKQFDEFNGSKVAFAKLQGISVTTLPSMLQKKECIEKTSRECVKKVPRN